MCLYLVGSPLRSGPISCAYTSLAVRLPVLAFINHGSASRPRRPFLLVFNTRNFSSNVHAQGPICNFFLRRRWANLQFFSLAVSSLWCRAQRWPPRDCCEVRVTRRGSNSEFEPSGGEPEPCPRARPQSKHQATPPALQRVRLLCWRSAAYGFERSVGRLVIVARSG